MVAELTKTINSCTYKEFLGGLFYICSGNALVQHCLKHPWDNPDQRHAHTTVHLA